MFWNIEKNWSSKWYANTKHFASTLNEALLLDHALKTAKDDDERLRPLRQLGGILLIVLGLNLAGVLKIPAPTVAKDVRFQHLLFSRNDMLVGGIRPHLYCLPVLKRERHHETPASRRP